MGLGGRAGRCPGGRPALWDDRGRRLEPRRRPRQADAISQCGFKDQLEQEEKCHGELLSDNAAR